MTLATHSSSGPVGSPARDIHSEDAAAGGAAAPRIAYLSLQAVEEGQDSWAAVKEFVNAARARGWTVDEWYPRYGGTARPGAWRRLFAATALQLRHRRCLREYDALYVRGHALAYPLCRWAARRGIPVVQECNGTCEDVFIAWPWTRAISPVVRWLQRRQFESASAVITVTPGLADWVKSETGRTDAAVVPNGANVDVFRPDVPRRPGLPERYAVFFGQLAPWQGTDVLLRAVRLAQWPSLELVVIGDGALRPLVEESVRDGAPVAFLGTLPYQQVPNVVAHAVASFVPVHNPSRAETGHSPLKLYESMACGVPVIASDVPGISEVVSDCGCGLLVPPGDAEALARALASVCDNGQGAREMGHRGHASAVREHSWRARADQKVEIARAAMGL